MSEPRRPSAEGYWGDTWVPPRFWSSPAHSTQPEAPARILWAGRRAAGAAPQQRHRVVLVYDVASDREGQRRYRRLVRLLEPIARRIQKSVFEGEFSTGELQRLVARVRLILHPQHDDFRCFPHCARCTSLSVVLFPKPADRPTQRKAWIA